MTQWHLRKPLFHPIVRIVLFAVISFALLIPFSIVLVAAIGTIVALAEGSVGMITKSPMIMLLTCYFYIPILTAIAICRNALDRANIASLGINIVDGWHKQLLLGFVGGFCMATLCTIFCILLGGASISGFGTLTILGFALYLAGLCFQSGMEELTMRGYVLQNLLTRYGIVPCIVVTSVLFSLLHMMNFTILPKVGTHIVVLSMINIAMFGALTALLLIRTGALWAAIGLHWSWNFSCGFIFGSPVSGLAFSESALRIQWHGSEILTGGSFGIEGSIIVTVVLLAILAWLSLSWRGKYEKSAWWAQVRNLDGAVSHHGN